MAEVSHQNLTSPVAIHPAAYVSSSDPGSVGAHKLWVDTSSGPPYQLKKRNAGNSAWESVGQTSSTLFDDTEGNPADVVGSGAADGTSTFTARRDHVHELGIITTRGDLIRGGSSGVPERVGLGATGTLLVSNGTDVVFGAQPYINVQEQQASGTNGGTFTSGAWQTRVLNTEVTDTFGIATLASNQITLPAGTYRCSASAPAAFVKNHQARLQDITGTATLLVGTTEYCTATDTDITTTRSFITGRFVLSVSSAIEVQHRCNTTRTTTGFGAPGSFGTEVYTMIELWKEG